jgi:hypothetical protein
MARGHRLEEIRAIGAAALLAVTRVDTALAHCRPAKASCGEIGELTATRHLGPPGSYRWIDQKSDGKNDDVQHERASHSLSPDCGVVLNTLVTVGETRCKLSQVALPDRLAAQRTERLRVGCPAIHQNEFHMCLPMRSRTRATGACAAFIVSSAADLVPEGCACLHRGCCCFDHSCGARLRRRHPIIRTCRIHPVRHAGNQHRPDVAPPVKR